MIHDLAYSCSDSFASATRCPESHGRPLPTPLRTHASTPAMRSKRRRRWWRRPGAQPAPAFSPLYQQIKTLILRSLQAGEWKPGDMIPSELDLAARFSVSQGTVRKAIDELATDNLLVRRQGKGTFVATHAEQHIQYRFLRLLPDTGSLEAQGPAERRIVECRRLRAPADVARQLGLRTGDSVLQVRRVLAFGGTPAILEDIWLPGTAFKGLTLETLAEDKGPMYALFETQFGVRMVRASEKIKAVSRRRRSAAELLAIAPRPPPAERGTPGLHLQRRAHGAAPRPLPHRNPALPQRVELKQSTHWTVRIRSKAFRQVDSVSGSGMLHCNRICTFRALSYQRVTPVPPQPPLWKKAPP